MKQNRQKEPNQSILRGGNRSYRQLKTKLKKKDKKTMANKNDNRQTKLN